MEKSPRATNNNSASSTTHSPMNDPIHLTQYGLMPNVIGPEPVRQASMFSWISATGSGRRPERLARYCRDQRRGNAAVFEGARNASGRPQPRLRLLQSGRIPDPSDAPGARSARRHRRLSRRFRNASAAVVRRWQLRLPPGWHEQRLAHGKDREFRARLHSRSRQASPRGRRIPHPEL